MHRLTRGTSDFTAMGRFNDHGSVLGFCLAEWEPPLAVGNPKIFLKFQSTQLR